MLGSNNFLECQLIEHHEFKDLNHLNAKKNSTMIGTLYECN